MRLNAGQARLSILVVLERSSISRTRTSRTGAAKLDSAEAGALMTRWPGKNFPGGCIFGTPVMKTNLRFFAILAAFFPACAGLSADLPAGVSAIPLKAPSRGAGGKLFTTLGAEQTGLTAVNRMIVDHPMNFMYHSGVTTGGVIVADFDGDGKPDIFFAGSTDPNRLYRQTGDLKFTDISASAGPIDGGDNWGTGAAAGDVNGDGRMDIYVCNYMRPNQLYLNMGPGSKGEPVVFKEAALPAGLDAIDCSHSAAFFDYDGDGRLDLYLLTNRIEDPEGTPKEMPIIKHADGTVSIKPEAEKYYAVWRYDYDNWGTESIGTPDRLYHNEGNGPDGVPRFKDVTTAAGISGRGDGLSVTVWDFNGDRRPDIYVGNDFIAMDKLYRNNGDGTFTDVAPEMIPHTSWFSMGADFGDLDNDLLPDLLVGDMSVTTHYKASTTMGVMGGIDLKRATTGKPSQHMQNVLLMNTGEGHFREGARLFGVSSTDWTWAVKFADFDNDGWLDIYCTNGISRHMNDSDKVVTIEMLRGKHMFEFFKEGEMRREMNRAFRNTHQTKFEDVSAAWGLDHVGVTYGAAYADLDRDGDLDLVTVNLEEPNFVYRNDSPGGQRVLIKLVGNGANKNAFGATVILRSASGAQTRQLEPQTGYLSCNEPLIHFGLGKDAVIEELTVRWPGAGEQKFKGLKAGMFYTIAQPADGGGPVTPEPAIAALFAKSDVLSLLKNKDTGRDIDFKKQPLLPFALSQLGPALAWGDVNGDGLDDFYIGGSAGEIGELRVNNGSGKFVAKWVDAFRADKDCEDQGAVFFDADGDGDLDLFVASGSNEFDAGSKSLRSRLYLNDGKGTFKLAPIDALPESFEFASAVCVADYDRDGKPDIFVGARTVPGDWPHSGKSRLLHNDSGSGAVKFSDKTGTVEGLGNAGLVTAAVWSDANGDGWPDLLVATEWGPVKLFQNEKGQMQERTKQAGLAGVTGWWRGIAAADVDHDGDLDYVATNIGLNTKYPQATPDRPQLLYYSDFDGTGKPKILEVLREGDRLFPERSRPVSSEAMPFIKEKFVSHSAFGKATIEDIFTPEKLRQAERYEAVEFQNGVFVNDGGRFTFRPLERIAQIAPGNSPVVCDFNGDCHPDVFLSQNSFSPIVEIPRFDGGLGQLLLGDGKGAFRAVSIRESGVAVPGDAKSASFTDLNNDGKPDLAVTVNSGAAAAFLNQSAARWLRVTVPAANAAGTRLTLKRGKLPPQLIELHAGTGYLAQDSATAFFGLGEKDAPGTVTAQWPDGTTTDTAYDGKAATLKLAPHKRTANQ